VLEDAGVDEVARAIRAAHQGELHLDSAVAKRLMGSLRPSKREDPGAELTDREREILLWAVREGLAQNGDERSS
jgi:DNA-binding NarL/FixJ family response regulator